MVTPIQSAAQAARAARKEVSGLPVIIRRGSFETLVRRATVGETRTEDFIEGQAVVSVRYRDFLIDALDYVVDGDPVAPQVDDKIVQSLGGKEVIFQVVPLPGEREYRRSDRSGFVWRVHTREAANNETLGPDSSFIPFGD